jgi:hypothetical protein
MTTRKRPVRSREDGKYHIDGKVFNKVIGSRREVFHDSALKTSGGLKKDDLLKNRWGRIVSLSKHKFESKTKRLLSHGYTACKGHFGEVRIKPNATDKSKVCQKFLSIKNQNGVEAARKAAEQDAISTTTRTTRAAARTTRSDTRKVDRAPYNLRSRKAN